MTLWLSAFSGRFRSRRYRSKTRNGRTTGDEPKDIRHYSSTSAQRVLMINAVDSVLAQRESDGNPVRVAMVGAGVTGRMIALQLATPIPGMRLVAIANRTVEKATQAFSNAGVSGAEVVLDLGSLEENIDKGRPSVVEEPNLVCEAGNIDVVLEVTGTVE